MNVLFHKTIDMPKNNVIVTVAEEMLIAGLSVVPVSSNKRPTVEWKSFTARAVEACECDRLFRSAWGLGIIGGAVSGGMEAIDFDAHGNDVEPVFTKYMQDDGIRTIVERNNVYVERSPSGGYHLLYKYESDKYEGSQCMARWDDGQTMIETRGEGAYIVVAPSPSYKAMNGSVLELPTISFEERAYMVEHARSFNRAAEQHEQHEEPSTVEATDPVSWYNWHKADHAKYLMTEAGWRRLRYDQREQVEYWQRPGKDDDAHSATWGRKHNALYVFTSSAPPLKPSAYYTPFQLLCLFGFKGNYRAATEWIVTKYFNEEVPYIRVGVDYFKRIVKTDRYGIERVELKRWAKEEIKQDHGKSMLDRVARFEDFAIVPSNFAYQPVVNNCYNLYREFTHKPVAGSWRWTKVLLQHIFGEQYALGLRYMQILYLHPDRLMPILVLVSRERQTGKTTFVNWLGMIFGDNMANIAPEDLVSGFNGQYAASNIIAVEETLIEKSVTVEKLKALATSKNMTVNQKYIAQYKTPFFGKIILTSNNEDKFARIDQEEIRFFIRKVGLPTHKNHNIENDMVREIPAFLHYLTTLPPVDFTVDRTGFTPEELSNETLAAVKFESRSGLYKDLRMRIESLFLNELSRCDAFYADQLSIRERFYARDPHAEAPYIRSVLKNEFGLTPVERVIRYRPFEEGMSSKTGRPFLFNRKDFVEEEIEPQTEEEIPF